MHHEFRLLKEGIGFGGHRKRGSVNFGTLWAVSIVGVRVSKRDELEGQDTVVRRWNSAPHFIMKAAPNRAS